jgi:D-serine deaminase-like pyridoxal phosphate-dependent protein
MIAVLPPLEAYLARELAGVQTPALLLYPAFVDGNIKATLGAMGGDANRWRPHVKTAKSRQIVRRLIAHGVKQFKCATTLELLRACEAGASDVLVAYPMVGANARRVLDIAKKHPEVAISVLAENGAQVKEWLGHPAGLFLDVNPGMDRTGIAQELIQETVELARLAGPQFRGLHYYDGHVSEPDPVSRQTHAEQGYRQLLKLISALAGAGLAPGEVITAGTPAMPCSLAFEPFRQGPFVHRVSPGTLVYNDLTSLDQLAAIPGLRPAALVVSSVVSHPKPGRFTCDAGHKSVSADAGVPTCAVLGHPDWTPLRPSEEHLPVDTPKAGEVPAVGEFVYLLPRHICPCINLFDAALAIEGGEVAGVIRLDARGHEGPVLISAGYPAGS